MSDLIAITRSVPASIAACELTHVDRAPIDVAVARAEHAAYERALAAPLGYEVCGVATRGYLHLETAVSAVADDLLLANPDWVHASAFGGLRTLDVDPAEPFAANALRVRERELHGAHCPRTRWRLARAGVTVVPVPAAELAKTEGGVTCGSLLAPSIR